MSGLAFPESPGRHDGQLWFRLTAFDIGADGGLPPGRVWADLDRGGFACARRCMARCDHDKRGWQRSW